MTTTSFEWWDSLRHFGLLLSPAEVGNLNTNYEPDELARWTSDQLRRELTRFEAGDLTQNDWISFVLEKVCGFNHEANGTWLRGHHVPTEWSHALITKENLKPTHLWVVNESVLPVFSVNSKRLGVGRGRKTISDCVQWLRAASQPFALITNGREWRLIYAGLDFDAACEWTIVLWFEEGSRGSQLWALRTLLQPSMFKPKEGDPPLLAAVLSSRRGQAELSSLLGERVRESVELLVQSHLDALTDAKLNEYGPDIYRAAVRVVMRLVVVLFAESRELLPRSDPHYHAAYGLNSLSEQLQRLAARGRARLGHRFSAWPRILSLFQLIFEGSLHPSLLVPAYGGELFAQGNYDDDKALNRALHVFERSCFDSRYQLMPDTVVHQMLELLTRTEMRIRQGRATIRTTMPVDFSDLSSEYIGILYEGLLDYELRTAPNDDPIVFLAVGDEPALPLARLEAMNDRDIKKLFEALKDSSGSKTLEGDVEEIDPSEILPKDLDSPKPPPLHDRGEEYVDAETEALELARIRATNWARKACLSAGLVRKPKASASPEALEVFENTVASKARQLVRRVVLPGDWYLVRWGGTRKGSGTFYTRPALAVPTAQRTLRKLVFELPLNKAGEPDEAVSSDNWKPKAPEEILALKVCDPACGSGSFLVAALRFLTDALFASLYAHNRLEGDWRRPLPELLGLELGEGYDSLRSARLPCPPDADDFADRTKGVLRRYVVERCIYGVDFDPLASELCRLALWIETMDRDLPFSFLDHKIRCGNALVGSWLDTFAHYPVMAWSREAGDKSHSNGVHFKKEQLTKLIKSYRANVVKPDLERFLMGSDLIQEGFQETAFLVHETSLQTLSTLHNLPVSEANERGRRYREQFLGSASYRKLKKAMDLWCAIWFWPATNLKNSPLPTNFASPTSEGTKIVGELAQQHRFFHWELEFPDVFNTNSTGFDAIIGNPPWDIAKPNSKEFFSNLDPLYRSYGNQDALSKQKELFSSEEIEKDWIEYNSAIRAQSNFFKFCSKPFGDPEKSKISQERFSVARGNRNEILHSNWRNARRQSNGFVCQEHPFQYQGSADTNLYKLFLEQSVFVSKDGGRVGMIVPAGIYSDSATKPLRGLFLESCGWEWLFGFINWKKIFVSVYYRTKFSILILNKGQKSKQLKVGFGRVDLNDWVEAEKNHSKISSLEIEKLSPGSLAILEVDNNTDLELLEKIYRNSDFLGAPDDKQNAVKYKTEYHMSSDSKRFLARDKLEKNGFKEGLFSVWESTSEQSEQETPNVAFPLYEGRMLGQYDFSSKGWVSGHGRGAVWDPIGWGLKKIKPRYLIPRENLDPKINAKLWPPKLAFMDVASSTNRRTCYAALIPDFPCGNKAPILQMSDWKNALCIASVLNSFVYDFAIRCRLGGLSITWTCMSETPIPKNLQDFRSHIILNAASLNLASEFFAPAWLEMRALFPQLGHRDWKSHWSISTAERTRRRCMLEALISKSYGITSEELAWMMNDCGHSAKELSTKGFTKRLSPKGFWRVDKHLQPEFRFTNLSVVALKHLEEYIESEQGNLQKALSKYCSSAEDGGWELPEKVRLTDFGLHPSFDIEQNVKAFFESTIKSPAKQSLEDTTWIACESFSRKMLDMFPASVDSQCEKQESTGDGVTLQQKLF